MNIYEIPSMADRIRGNSYVGRGIVTGRSADGKKAVFAYFIMGRSENSRNRIFLENGEEVIIHPFDAAKAGDPSLIIYSPVKCYRNHVIVTNGNQTDTVYDFLKEGKTFAEALDTRCFEPDGPNFTPRISAMLTFANSDRIGDFSYQMNILKSADPEGSACVRMNFAYPALPGLGHFLHTYICDGKPIPTFCGEPERVAIPDDIDAFTKEIWENLDEANKISLYVRYIDLASGEEENRLINKNK